METENQDNQAEARRASVGSPKETSTQPRPLLDGPGRQAELDEREERISTTRRPMGPPLNPPDAEPLATARDETISDVAPVDPLPEPEEEPA